jgi:hypothetical protein
VRGRKQDMVVCRSALGQGNDRACETSVACIHFMLVYDAHIHFKCLQVCKYVLATTFAVALQMMRVDVYLHYHNKKADKNLLKQLLICGQGSHLVRPG